MDASFRGPLRSRAGRDQPLAVPPDLAADDHVGVLILGVGPGASPRALRALARPPDGAAWPVREPRRRPVLHFLRVHPDSALLPDRALWRARSSSSLGDILPLYPGRKPADTDRGDRARRRPLPAQPWEHP